MSNYASSGGRFDLRDVARQLRDCWFVFLIPVAILGSIFTGLATVTESAVLGLVMVIIAGRVYSGPKPGRIMELFAEGVRQSAVIGFGAQMLPVAQWGL